MRLLGVVGRTRFANQIARKEIATMSTQDKSTKSIGRPRLVCYIGRPVSLYIDAMAKRRRITANPASSAGGSAEQPISS
jgi:hypothetical protein